MQSTVITGASGFIGKALTKNLLNKGVKVYAIVRNPDKLMDLKQYSNLEIIILDANEYLNLKNIIPETVDVFYHLAWEGALGKEPFLQIKNIYYSVSALEAAIQMDIKKFIFCGSSYSYMYKEGTNKDWCCNIYGSAKKSASEICRAIALDHNLKYHVAILTNTFGVGDYSQKAVNSLIQKFIYEEPITLVQDNRLNDWVYIDDAVNGLVLVGEKGVNWHDYYIGHEKILSFGETITIMRDALAPDRKLNFGVKRDNTEIDYERILSFNNHHEIEFTCKNDFKESFIKTAEWIKHVNDNLQKNINLCVWVNYFKDYESQFKNVIYSGDAISVAKKMSCKHFVLSGTTVELEVKKIYNQIVICFEIHAFTELRN